MSRVVLVHGFTQTGRSWAPVAERLGVHHEVLCPDVAGHGTAAGLDVDLWGAARHLGEAAGTAAYVGYSMGGRIALHLALADPATVTALVLVSTTAGIEDRVEREARAAADDALADRVEAIGTDRFLEEWLARPLFAGLPPARAGDRSRDAAGLAASLRSAGTGRQEPLWDRLGEITAPVLVVVGERDAKFRALGARLAAGIADATMTTVPGAGHAVHLEQPEAFLAAVAPWLEAHAGHAPTARPRPSSAP